MYVTLCISSWEREKNRKKKKRMQNYIPLSQLLIFSLHPILKSNDLWHSWEEKRMVAVPLSVRKKLLC